MEVTGWGGIARNNPVVKRSVWAIRPVIGFKVFSLCTNTIYVVYKQFGISVGLIRSRNEIRDTLEGVWPTRGLSFQPYPRRHYFGDR